jgi:uroporphyrinogen decarboxylase
VNWTSRERLLAALDRLTPDRLPATTHHLMPYFLETHLGGMTQAAFWDHFGLDAILWTAPLKPDAVHGQRLAHFPSGPGLEGAEIVSDEWRIEDEELAGQPYPTRRFRIVTPRGMLTTSLAFGEHTSWQVEPLVKVKTDIDLIGEYAPGVACDAEAVNRAAKAFGQRGIVRGAIASFPLFGQPGCWQDAACLVGIERLILETFDDPGWVHALLGILQQRKSEYIRSLDGARYDLLELGGGSASTTVISPKIFARFVAPYDGALIDLAHQVGQRIAYHTCGGMMPILEAIADMAPDAMETFTPPGMGGDADLAEAKRRIGDRVCMIGGLDQFHSLWGCSPGETRRAVRRCFEEAGAGGGYILAPSDHFFDADPALIAALADEAQCCVYGA